MSAMEVKEVIIICALVFIAAQLLLVSPWMRADARNREEVRKMVQDEFRAVLRGDQHPEEGAARLGQRSVRESQNGTDIIVRVLHPSGTGGTSLCNIVKETRGARLTNFQLTQNDNCNFDGSGPKTRRHRMEDSPWRKCSVMADRENDWNWVFVETGFDFEFPCPSDSNVKHVMLFREPWRYAQSHSLTRDMRPVRCRHRRGLLMMTRTTEPNFL